MNLYDEAAAEIEWLAEDFRDTNAGPVVDADTGIVGLEWPDPDDEQEYNRLMDLVHRLRGRAIEGPCLCVAAEHGSCERCGISAHEPKKTKEDFRIAEQIDEASADLDSMPDWAKSAAFVAGAVPPKL